MTKKKINKNWVPYKKTFVGMKIVDKEGAKGEIIERDDIHNVHIKYPFGWGFYCLDENCHEYESFIQDKNG